MNKIEWLEYDFHIKYKNMTEDYHNKAIIVIPLFNEIPTKAEIRNLNNLIYIYKSFYLIVFVVGQGFNLDCYRSNINYPIVNVLYVNREFINEFGIHQLFARNEFYSLFKEYEYLVSIYTNVYIYNIDGTFQNYLDFFLHKDFDYAASLVEIDKDKNLICDKGIAIRKISTFMKVIEEQKNEVLDYNELFFFNFEKFRLMKNMEVFSIEKKSKDDKKVEGVFAYIYPKEF